MASLSEPAVQKALERGLLDAFQKTERAPLEVRLLCLNAVLDHVFGQLGMPELPRPPGRRIRLKVGRISPLDGIFKVGSWTIVVDERLLTRGPMPKARVVKLAEILGHELRHPEHRFRMACWRADLGQPSDIGMIGVPQHIIDEALRPERPRLEGKRAAEAKRWFTYWIAPERKKNTDALSQVQSMLDLVRARQAMLREELEAAHAHPSPARSKEEKALRKSLAETAKEEARWSRELGRLHEAGEKLPLERDCQRVGQALARRVARQLGG